MSTDSFKSKGTSIGASDKTPLSTHCNPSTFTAPIDTRHKSLHAANWVHQHGLHRPIYGGGARDKKAASATKIRILLLHDVNEGPVNELFDQSPATNTADEVGAKLREGKASLDAYTSASDNERCNGLESRVAYRLLGSDENWETSGGSA